jgi:hypothetical protein
MRWHLPQEDFGVVLDRYERYLRGRDYSENSIVSGKRLLSKFLKFAKDPYPSIEQADAFREILLDRKLAPGTINRRYTLFSCDGSWLFISVRTSSDALANLLVKGSMLYCLGRP